MSEEAKWGAAGFIAGGLFGAALGYRWGKGEEHLLSEEDRPPIIVRGGSLIFESGHPRDPNPKKRKGKPWKYEGGWKPHHRKGRSISGFNVSFESDTGCRVEFARKVLIAYKHLDGEASFTLAIEVDGESGRPAPVILTNEPMLPEIDPSKPLQTLTFRPAGKVVWIEFDDQTKCENPGVVHFDPTS